ncbi:ABC transporter ATP-binding protein [Olsenella sp. DNF00959]|uniref:ABC transporter ATP-binding protein n=1 Tax=Olsenella sp. DNF00959 TaxID=1476999 RepID=UPI00078040D6|nr:ABC transporter ATP-binding protein [Olsenella sp. DNF00959]KXB63467.1 putative ATP synthase F0, A subunit [Olsenella sp. DNF00959]
MLELLRRYLGPYRAKAAFGMLAKVVEVAFELLVPVIVASMVDVGVARHDGRAIALRGGLLVVLALVGFCFTTVCQKMAALVSQGMGTDLREASFAKAVGLSAVDVDRLGPASLVTRITSDVNQVQLAIALGIRQLIRWPFLGVGSIVAALLIDWRLGLVFLVCTPVIALVFWAVLSRCVPYFRSMQEKLDHISLLVREALGGARVMRAFRREDHERGRFRVAAASQAADAIASGRLSSLLNPTTLLVMDLGVVVILWLGGVRVDSGALTQGKVIAFVNYMTQTLLSIVYIANLVVVFTRGAASAQRLVEVLDCEPSVVDLASGPVEPLADAPALELEGVSFAYPGAAVPALDGVTLTLARGGSLGVIGGTGSGKSTLVSLVPRLYDAASGSVRVLGHDVREYPSGQLRSHVGLVPQKAALVSGTVRSNLLWRKGDVGDEELWSALATAQAEDFVRDKEGGLDAVVEAGGRNFSGGQLQRLTIARALVGEPELVVLDDSASALDLATDARLRAALARDLSQSARVIVSQRVSSVRGCDQILVLDHGRPAGLGTHEELVGGCPLYREICLSQLSEREVLA